MNREAVGEHSACLGKSIPSGTYNTCMGIVGDMGKTGWC